MVADGGFERLDWGSILVEVMSDSSSRVRCRGLGVWHVSVTGVLSQAPLVRCFSCVEVLFFSSPLADSRPDRTERFGVGMKQRHISLRFSLFAGLLSLLICVLTLAAPSALALSGKIREFAVPTANSRPVGITAGPDGALWFTENNTNKIGRITTAGVVTEFAVPTANSVPAAITAGPDGNLWFTEFGGNNIGRISPTGKHQLAEFAIPTANSGPSRITAGPDGNLWFTEGIGNKIGQLR